MRGIRKKIWISAILSIVILILSNVFVVFHMAKGAVDSVHLSVEINVTLTFKALPEKISAQSNDHSSHVIIEIRPAGGGPVLFSGQFDTDSSGIHNNPETLPDFDIGYYDIYAKGYSHLTKKKSNVQILAGNNFVDFSSGDTEYLLAGDVNVLNPLDPWKRGDDMVNSIDLAMEIEKLDIGNDVEKEDVNKDGLVNSIDLGIAIENLDKVGDN